MAEFSDAVISPGILKRLDNLPPCSDPRFDLGMCEIIHRLAYTNIHIRLIPITFTALMSLDDSHLHCVAKTPLSS